MNWIPFEPELTSQEAVKCHRTARALARRPQAAVPKYREHLLGELDRPLSTRRLRTRLAQSVLLDLAEQGWKVRTSSGKISIRTPGSEGETPEEAKERIRQAHLVDRDLQLRQPAVQDFIRSMEQRRLTRNGWHSIFSLMRDGRELVNALETGAASDQADALTAAISPYLQFVEPEAVCEHTDLKLSDIWRYFRLTWVNAYRSLPGRTISILVRDAAAANHPVIGIAALGSSMVQQESRDKWIGWTAQEFLKSLEHRPPARVKAWILERLENLIGDVYVDDLVKDGLLKRRDLSDPSAAIVERLQAEAADARTKHWRNPSAPAHRAHQHGVGTDWEEAARTSLFRSKRCETLARLLAIRLALDEHLRDVETKGFSDLLASSATRAALAQLVRRVKAQRVGIDMMDITVCGAVAPYNALLGGKLVCMLLASREVVAYYRKKYETQASVIASSIKGEAVRRPPRLVLLGTTSLYGIGSSQYNRVKVPCREVCGRSDETLEYKKLGLSKGYGSFHFSGTTIKLVDALLGRGDGRRVNSLFGEGVNPLLRKIREALELLKLHSDKILNHGNPRVVYGVALARNFKEVLLAFDDEPAYLVPGGSPRRSTQQLASYWRRRWLAPRAAKLEIREAVKKHTLAYPVTHGARVMVWPSEGQRGLDFLTDAD